jgi:polyhydroxyalkanoate synthesis regulator phasin
MMGFRGINPYLADALGISVAELEQAQEQANEALINQAIEDGTITQEQADLMQAGKALRDYLPEAMAHAFEEALQNAVADGVITQAQADKLSEMKEGGFRGFGGRKPFGPWFVKDK